MKTKYLVLVALLIGMFTDCSSEADDDFFIAKPETWSLVKVSGGVAGVDDDFVKGTVTWDLSVAEGILVIKNDYEGNNIYSGPNTGNYPYTIKTLSDNTILMVIGGQEFGGLTHSEKEVEINQNVTSNGTGADGFILNFKR